MKIITSVYTDRSVGNIFLYTFLIVFKCYLKTFPKCYLKTYITFTKKKITIVKNKYDDGIASKYMVKFEIICSRDHGT